MQWVLEWMDLYFHQLPIKMHYVARVSFQEFCEGKLHFKSIYKERKLWQICFFFSPPLHPPSKHKTTQRAYFQRGGAAREDRKIWITIRPLETAQGRLTDTRRGILDENIKINSTFTLKPGSLALLDADMRWKSEVKVECCVVSEDETGSLLSNDEVSNDN